MLSADIFTTDFGTIIRLQGRSARGKRWMTRHVPDAVLASADCDHRCGMVILEGILDAGLVLEDTRSGRQAARL